MYRGEKSILYNRRGEGIDMVTGFADWSNFYVMVGSASGALIGLQFVVITLIAQKPELRVAGDTAAAFLTPSILQFGTTLFVSAVFLAPWFTTIIPSGLVCVAGISGIAYTAMVALRMRRQMFYLPNSEDWIFHIILPMAAFTVLVGAFPAIHVYLWETMFGIASAALLLLFIGIRNAWDNISYMVFVHGAESE
ncbi:MAG TPA: hypothetical protein VMS89_05930 [Methanoregulaceae archaeon]|nr:hypothetical protein [Methanoregulaceae archaeon]